MIVNSPTTDFDYRTSARILTEHMARYGYEIIEVPVIQPANLFLTKAGDKIIHRLFTFERRGQQLALRPEFTAVAAYRYLTEGRRHVVRWQFSGPIFEESDNSHKEAYQQYSVGAELIGLPGCIAEAEVIIMALEGCRLLGLTDITLFLGHTGLMRHLLGLFELDDLTNRFLLTHRHELKPQGKGKAYLIDLIHTILPPQMERNNLQLKSEGLPTRRMLDVLLDSTRRGSTMGGRSREDIARRLLKKYERAYEFDRFLKALDFLEVWVNLQGEALFVFEQLRSLITDEDVVGQNLLVEWSQLLRLLEHSNAKIVIEPNLARSWDYYTGIVFGIQSRQGDFVVGGGRYDDLIRHLGGDISISAVGFAYYMRPLLQTAEHFITIQKPVIFQCELENYHHAFRWAQNVRAVGQSAIITTDEVLSDEFIIITQDGMAQYANRNFYEEELDQLLAYLKG